MSRSAVRRRRAARGFSLFEMMIALALAAGLSVLVATSFAPAASRVRLKAEAAELAAILASARTRAVTERRVMRIVLDTRSQTIIAGDPAIIRELPAGLTLAIVRATDDGDGENRGDIAFFPDGGASGAAFSVADGSQTITFRINWLTGRISTTTGRLRAG